MPTITRLQLSRQRKGRVRVHLDHEYAFSLPLELASALHKGQDLTADEISALQGEDTYRRALDRALRYLGYRPRSQSEVEVYLARKDTPEEVVEHVMAHLIDLGLIDDRAFAEWWVDNRLEHQPRGLRALRHELAVRGVGADLISTAIEQVDEEALAAALALKQAPRYEALERNAFRRKLGGFLRRRGFGAEAVRLALDKAWTARSVPTDGPGAAARADD